MKWTTLFVSCLVLVPETFWSSSGLLLSYKIVPFHVKMIRRKKMKRESRQVSTFTHSCSFISL